MENLTDKPIDVFISRKSVDAKNARILYKYLVQRGLNVFVSDITLAKKGNSDYTDEINKALEETTHMIVVSSSPDNLNSKWVKSEWTVFINRKRSGGTAGNVLTVTSQNVKIKDLPLSLRHYEVVPFNIKNFPIIYNYVRQPNEPACVAPEIAYPAPNDSKVLRGILIAMVFSLIPLIFRHYTQPLNVLVYLTEKPQMNLSPHYPKFDTGELSLSTSKGIWKQEARTGKPTLFKHVVMPLFKCNVKLDLNSKYWKLERDSSNLSDELNLKIVPNDRLATISGSVQTSQGLELDSVKILIEGDTLLETNGSGQFRIILPYKLQRESYRLVFRRKGYRSVTTDYYPVSGRIDIIMSPETNQRENMGI
ncbi:hypothetical protein Dfri01_10260 [Dyadobacter frigoris]|uniref:TIR domain-containing protein n=1 Tax=Dyadobacter frigoris TaxID=2576211 RepID=UPI0024A11D7F|nr:TIR domain-containing protein [Dyadobacter frigoris]GLU51565.1 hypothetical protein Dfri01_10260 [Dyadobacter frigoris]